MNGLRIMEMDAADALDVIHVLFEADHAESAPEQHQTRDRVRRIIYTDLYGIPYTRGSADSAQPTTADAGPAGSAGGGGAHTGTKPYIPPTAVEDLPRVLGAPLG